MKAFIVLTSEYKEADKESLKKDIQEHVKRVTAPYKYPRKASMVLLSIKAVNLKLSVIMRTRQKGIRVGLGGGGWGARPHPFMPQEPP